MGAQIQQATQLIQGNVQVTSSGNTIPIFPAGATCKAFEQNGTGALQTIYTPGAGKTFYLCGVSANLGANGGNIYSHDGTTHLLIMITTASLGLTIAPGVPMDQYTSSTPLKANFGNGQTFVCFGFEV